MYISQIILYFCKINSKGIKKALKIFGFSVAGIVIFSATVFILLRISKIQNFVAQSIVRELSDKLHTKVTLGSIDYKFFNSIDIHELYVEDLQHDTLLYTKVANARFDFWSLFHSKVMITSIELDHFYGNLKIDKTGKSNLDFVVNAFKKPKTKDSTNVSYHIEHFVLKNSAFSYTNLKSYRELPNGVLNGNKLRFQHINTEISLNSLAKDSVDAEILSLSAIEKSGFCLKNFSTKIIGTSKGLILPGIELQLPNSKLHLENAFMKFDSLSDLKQMAEKVRWNIQIKKSNIALVDLQSFVPDFKRVSGVVSLEGHITGRIASLRFKKMIVRYGKSFLLNADLDINGLPQLNEAFIYGQINDLHFQKNDLQDFISDVSKKPFLLPKIIDQLGMIHYKGNITGFLSNLVAYGNLNTSVGSVSTDILLKFENKLQDLSYNGTIKSANLQLGKLLNNKQIGKVAFNFNTNGKKIASSSLQGEIKAIVSEFEFNKYVYRDIKLRGQYDGKGFDGDADIKDDNIQAHFSGVINNSKKLPIYDFDLQVPVINLNALHLINNYPGATLSFNGKTQMVGNSLDNINGYVVFDGLRFVNQGKELDVEMIKLESRISNNFTNFVVTSDFVNGSIKGDFKYSTISKTINKIIQNYLPALSSVKKTDSRNYYNQLDIDLNISNTAKISEVLNLPYTLEGNSLVKGSVNEKINKLEFLVNIPSVKSAKQKMDNLVVHIDNSNQLLKLNSNAQLEGKNGITNISLTSTAAKDSVSSRLIWQDLSKLNRIGEVKAVAKFWKEQDKTAALVSILPTQIVIADSVWNIHACNIDLNADSTIYIHNFRFDSKNQYLHVDGLASKKIKDGVSVDMNQVDLGFVLHNILKLKGISIGGVVTGKATLLSLLKQPVFEANLFVKNAELNHKVIGDAQLFSTWDRPNEQMYITGDFVNDKNIPIANAKGVFVPKTDSLDFIIDAHKLSIDFLTPYFESVVQNVKGYGTGKIRMFGPSKVLGFEGNAYIENGQGSVKMLKTTYFFNDTVRLTRKTLSFKNVTLYDQERNPASLNVSMNHNGLFQHLKYDVKIKGNNMLALNTQAEDNDYFFGKAYANGTVHIYGDEKEANIWVNAVSQPQSKCYIQMGGASKAADNSFINFVNKKIVVRKEETPVKATNSAINVKVNLQIDVTPNAEMELIVDPKGGDVITGRGNGNLRVEFDSFSDIKLYGTYVIDNGYYLFTLQNLIRKEFKVDRGSTLSWTGNPFSAQVNIRALYSLTASLRDLLSEDQLKSIRSSVPVNCVLKLSDDLMKPTVKFEVELPTSDEGVKQQVRTVINTDEMMNRQIVYLLLFNKFFQPDYLRAATSNVFTNEGLSFAVSTLSAQLNSLVNKVTKSNNISVGFDYRQTDLESSDIQAKLFYQPNNRWVVNGNIGYRNDLQNTNPNANKFIGDVDVEYLLTQSGKLRLKGYNHSVDRYHLGTAKTTQGFGFLYKEDFKDFDELFKYYWRLISLSGKKKSNEEVEIVK